MAGTIATDIVSTLRQQELECRIEICGYRSQIESIFAEVQRSTFSILRSNGFVNW